MSINLDVEKQRKLSTQDMYDILHFAAQSAEDNGFVNSFVFERALLRLFYILTAKMKLQKRYLMVSTQLGIIF